MIYTTRDLLVGENNMPKKTNMEMNSRVTLRSPKKEALAKAVSTMKPRTCLKCGETFPSLGLGNRICESCTQENLSVAKRTERGGKHHRENRLS